jgi:membrane dipeptidase
LELNAENLISKTPVIDLHIDSFIWTRIFGYDWQKPHSDLLTKGYFAGQVDLPRLKNGGFSGAIWSITTNPLRTSLGRARTFEKNLNQFKKWIAENPTQLKLISTAGDFDSIQSKDQHAMWISVQGGNAIDHDLNLIEKFAPEVTSVTLMHLMHSKIGTSMTPYPTFRKRGLTQFGRDFVGKLNKHRIFVDLAHADRETFMDVIKVHDSSQPLTGGVVGIIFEPNFLGKGKKGEPLDQILNHLEYIQKTIGDDFAALGSDWDGMIVPPKRLRSAEQFPALVTLMMKRGWTRNQIEKVLGLNYLRAFRLLRP